ncbi:apolipophorin-3 [Anabrus simplex]|uniref:apolipophorin-3 n=1 Tax=Anabrus simplex TaxID=316456 RepID=UPI0035A2CE2B
MKVFIALIAALCMFQGLSAAGVKHRRDTNLQNSLEDIWNNAQTFFQNFTAEIQRNTPSTDEAVKQVKSTAESLATKLQQVATQMTEQAHTATGTLSEALTAAATNINTTLTNIRANHPDAAHQADVFKQNVQNMMQTMLDETKKVKDQLQGPLDSMKQTITTITENGLNDAKRLLEQAQHHLQEATAH